MTMETATLTTLKPKDQTSKTSIPGQLTCLVLGRVMSRMKQGKRVIFPFPRISEEMKKYAKY
jgi:hypothetical protein